MDFATDILDAIEPFVQAGGTLPWLSTQDDSAPDYAIDTDCWTYGYSANNFRSRAVLSPIGRYGGPTLIREAGRSSTRFAVAANHFVGTYKTGGACRWIKADGTPVEREIVNSVQIGTSDVRLILLDQPVDYSDVEAAWLLPADADDYLEWRDGVLAVSVLASFASTQTRVVLQEVAGQVHYIVNGSDWLALTTREPAATALYEEPAKGASGSPLYVAAGGTEILLGCWYGAHSVPALHRLLAELQTAASGLAGEAVGFATVDLSDYDTLPPGLEVWASTTTVATPGDPVTLSWRATRATTVTLNGTPVALSGSQVVEVTEDTTYTVVATDGGGQTTEQIEVIVHTPPAISFAVDPPTIEQGETAELSWSVTGADSVAINQGIGSVSAEDTAEVSPETSTVYTLTATKDGVETHASVVLTVTGAAFEPTEYQWVGDPDGIDSPFDNPAMYNPPGIPMPGDWLVFGNEAQALPNRGGTTASNVRFEIGITLTNITILGDVEIAASGCGFEGGHIYGALSYTSIGTQALSPLYDVTFHTTTPITINASSCAGCTFHGDVTVYTANAVESCHVHGNLVLGDYATLGLAVVDGTTVFGNSAYAGSTVFNGPVQFPSSGELAASLAVGGHTFNDRISWDGGSTWFYAPSSPAVAPPAKVLEGTTNLGVPGELPRDHVLPASGGTLKVPSGRIIRPGVHKPGVL